MLSPNKDVNKLLKLAQQQGWRFEKKRKHVRGYHADGVRMVTVSVSPSCPRAIDNIRKDLGL